VGAILFGAIVFLVFQPVMSRGIALRRLFSADARLRSKGAAYFLAPITIESSSSGNPESREVPRLSRDLLTGRRMVRLLRDSLESGDPNDAVFCDVVKVLNESGWWVPKFVVDEVWYHRVKLLLEDRSPEAAQLAFVQMVRWPADSPDASKADAAPLWHRLTTYENDADLRRHALIEALHRLGSEGAENVSILSDALRDTDANVRRAAWISIGICNPLTGFRADWKSESDSSALEAVLWASIHTNPDRTTPLIEAIQSTPWRTTALPWLLSLSTSDEALDILRGLQTDGNPAALIPLAMKLGNRAEVFPPRSAAALLGLGQRDDYVDSSLLLRMYLWRNRTNASVITLDAFRRGASAPTAEDGSVWASVLLAERMLSPADASHLALNWLKSLDEGERRAGLLLCGLTGSHQSEIERMAESGEDRPEVMRYLRLARMMIRFGKGDQASDNDRSLDIDKSYAKRLISPSLSGRDLDVLLALLDVDDKWAAREILGIAVTDERQDHATSAPNRLLQFGWLLERFCKAQYDVVAPFDPWNRDVARLQLDIMRISHAIEHGLAFN